MMQKQVTEACLDPEVVYTPDCPAFFMVDNINWKELQGQQTGTVVSKMCSLTPI